MTSLLCLAKDSETCLSGLALPKRLREGAAGRQACPEFIEGFGMTNSTISS